jgi:hypothetical protein
MSDESKKQHDIELEEIYQSSLEQLHDGYPLQFVEDFGIWHLTLRQAAELTAVDMWFSGDNDFNIEEPENFGGNPQDPQLLAMLAVPIARFEQSLISSVNAGHVKANRVGRDFDGNLDSLRTYIRLQDLEEWLRECDYETGDIFGEYQSAEAEIAAAITDEVVHLRALARRGHGEIQKFANQVWLAKTGKLDNSDTEGLLAALKSTIAENERLKAKLASAGDGRPAKVDRPLSTRARRTLLTIIAALCEHAKLDPQARGTAQRIREASENLGAPVDDETIRSALREIDDALETRMK